MTVLNGMFITILYYLTQSKCTRTKYGYYKVAQSNMIFTKFSGLIDKWCRWQIWPFFDHTRDVAIAINLGEKLAKLSYYTFIHQLAFQNGMEDGCIITGNDLSTSDRNTKCFGSATPDFTRLNHVYMYSAKSGTSDQLSQNIQHQSSQSFQYW